MAHVFRVFTPTFVCSYVHQLQCLKLPPPFSSVTLHTSPLTLALFFGYIVSNELQRFKFCVAEQIYSSQRHKVTNAPLGFVEKKGRTPQRRMARAASNSFCRHSNMLH